MNIEDYNSNEEVCFEQVSEINLPSVLNSELLLIHVNIRSINRSILKLETLINSFKNKPDAIICSDRGCLKKLCL